jgi:hypothetical protein
VKQSAASSLQLSIRNHVSAAPSRAPEHAPFDDSVFANFEAVMAAATQAGNDVLITLNGANSIRLSNVALESLHANDFLFTF